MLCTCISSSSLISRLAIKYIRHLQFLLAAPPGSTVDFEATNFSLDPLPSWRSINFAPDHPEASTSIERHSANSYDLSSIVYRNSGQHQSFDSMGGDAHRIEQQYPHLGQEQHAFSCNYEEASPLNWTQSN